VDDCKYKFVVRMEVIIYDSLNGSLIGHVVESDTFKDGVQIEEKKRFLQTVSHQNHLE
jgi:hypothetical protein